MMPDTPFGTGLPGIPAPTGGQADHLALQAVVEIVERLLGRRGPRAGDTLQSLPARLKEIERRLAALESP
jgi:hypothetical protein